MPLPLRPDLCRIGGVNQNHVSGTGTPYHIQIEDLGPVKDRVSGTEVRRLNMILYANYGTPRARIVYGRDHDLTDVRTVEYNLVVKMRMQELLSAARYTIESHEERQLLLIRTVIRERTSMGNDAARQAFEEYRALYPFLAARALSEAREEERSGIQAASAAPEPSAVLDPKPGPLQTVVYPLDDEMRRLVFDIENVIVRLGHDFLYLKASGKADDVLFQACKRLVTRARRAISGREASDFNVRRLEMTLDGLVKVWMTGVRSRL
jgi:hypothetical protein